MTAQMDRLGAALAGRYEIEEKLGEGGMADVYLARDVRHERRVALKVLRPELAATMGADRFLREIRVTANLQHPHILPLFDSGEAGGFLFYVMPYLDGESLRARLDREGELPVAEAVKILREVTDALTAAHALGVVHRDIKPDNVMLTGRHAVVTDFGVAKAVSEATGRHQLTTKGVALGTPAYMAPEQAAADEHIDHRADIYAVGVLGYELLTGRPPFTGLTAQRVLAAHVTEAARPLTELRATVPQGLADVVMRCLEKKPADRWQSAEELLDRLEPFATASGGVTPAQSAPAPRSQGRSRFPRWAKLASGVVVATALLAVWLTTRGPTARKGPDSAIALAAIDTAAGFIILPFVNQTGVDSLDMFGPMVADYVTGQVSRNRLGWVVPSQTVRDLAAERKSGEDAVTYFSGASGAHYVVSGSYYLRGDRLIVQGEVTDGRTSELMASVGPVEGATRDPLAPARATAEQVLVILARILNPDALFSPPPAMGGMPATFSAYQDYMDAVDRLMEGDQTRALELLNRSLAADSTYAEALLMKSSTEWTLGSIPRADSVIRIAHRYRDRMSPWDQTALDWLQGWFDGDVEATYRAGRRWAELDPVHGTDCRGARRANRLRQAVADCTKGRSESFDKAGVLGFFWTDYLTSLHILGDHEKELEEARVARRYNPGAAGAFRFEARALAALGRTVELRRLLDEAETHTEEGFDAGMVIREAGRELVIHGRREAGDSLLHESLEWYREHGVTSTGTARSLFATGDYAGARDLCEGQLRDDPDNVDYLGLLGSSAAALGDRKGAAAASAMLAKIEERPYVFGGPTAWRALIAAQLGDKDEAVRLLGEAYANGYGFGMWLHTYPQLDGLRGYPPFERFVAPRE